MSTGSDKTGRGFTRRRFLASTSALSASSFSGLPRIALAESPPETTRLRLVDVGGICLAPGYLAEELLRLEGFSDVKYVAVDYQPNAAELLEHRVDIAYHTPPDFLPALDAGGGSVVLSGLHGGCYELFANDRVRTIRDLAGKRIAVSALGGVEYYFLAAMVAYVGLDPKRDIDWVDVKNYDRTMEYFVDGKVDAFLAFPPQPQDLRAKKVGHVIVDTGHDRPWDQYFCCMIAARQDFVNKNPIATKRALRAILKTVDICARQPERAARYMVAKGYESRYEVALEVLKSVSYTRWRTYDPEDSMRFYGVRLYEAGMIKTSPQKLIAQGTNWRFLDELKRELKA